MDLRKKLTILFLGLIASIIIISSLVIYFWFSEYRRSDFYDRMLKKAQSVAELLIDVDEVDAKLLKKIENTRPVSVTGENIIIYNSKDEIIYRNASGDFHLTIDQLKKIRKEGSVNFTDKTAEALGLYYKGKYDSAVVAIEAKDISGLTKLNKLKIILISVSFFSLILVYFSGLFFVGKALNPVAKLIRQVDNITISNINQRLDEGKKRDDLERLAVTFNKMLKRLESSFILQRIFIANASHELRTPLTVITGQLEIALIKERDNEDYKRIIHSVLEDITNVNQLANRLLLIAQASSNFETVELQKIRVDDIIWQARQEIKKMNPGYSVMVYFAEDLEDENNFTIQGNEILLKTAFNNLIENSCKYSPNHTVNIYFGTADSKIQIRFVDQGVGISSGELKMVFEPFYRGKNTTGIKGHGIGLSLVKNIINLHKGDITVQSVLNSGSEFIISLPVYKD